MVIWSTKGNPYLIVHLSKETLAFERVLWPCINIISQGPFQNNILLFLKETKYGRVWTKDHLTNYQFTILRASEKTLSELEPGGNLLLF